MKNYVGRKCKGFRFESGTDGLSWTTDMETHIGEIGVITKQDNTGVAIKFENDWWYYPISLIEEYLIPETPEIPQLGEGIEMEVSHLGDDWWKTIIIAQRHDGVFINQNGVFYKHARPIHKVKKYTKEELVKIVGHDFEIV
jgi:hypothetical protein